MGFCFLNNVGLAATAALKQGVKRILIVDWDVHANNGTYKMFKSDPRVLLFSAHRLFADNNVVSVPNKSRVRFYPGLPGAEASDVGTNRGEGFTVNVAWPVSGVGDQEYLWAWDHVLLPIASEFDPELVLVSAGFDAARGDQLGECDITPRGYSQLLKKLLPLANGKIVLVLEGGYNLDAIASSCVACANVLLDRDQQAEDVPNLRTTLSSSQIWVGEACIEAICSTLEAQSKYWSSLKSVDETGGLLTDELLVRALDERLAI
jgi:acetoin utilization deacetylase AcuC-like enzyme